MSKSTNPTDAPMAWLSQAAHEFAGAVAAIEGAGCCQCAAATAAGFAANVESLVREIGRDGGDRLTTLAERTAGDREVIAVLADNFRTDAALGVARLPRIDDTAVALQLLDMAAAERDAVRAGLRLYCPVVPTERERFAEVMLALCVPPKQVPAPDGGQLKLWMILVLVETALLFPEKTRRVINAINKLTALDLELNPGGADEDAGSGPKNCGDSFTVTGKGQAPTPAGASLKAIEDAQKQANDRCPSECPARIVNPPSPRPSVGAKKNGLYTATVTAQYRCR